MALLGLWPALVAGGLGIEFFMTLPMLETIKSIHQSSSHQPPKATKASLSCSSRSKSYKKSHFHSSAFLQSSRVSYFSWLHRILPTSLLDWMTCLHHGILTYSNTLKVLFISFGSAISPSKAARITQSSRARPAPAPCHGVDA